MSYFFKLTVKRRVLSLQKTQRALVVTRAKSRPSRRRRSLLAVERAPKKFNCLTLHLKVLTLKLLIRQRKKTGK